MLQSLYTIMAKGERASFETGTFTTLNGSRDQVKFSSCSLSVALLLEAMYRIYSPISRIFGSEKSYESQGSDLLARHMFKNFFTVPKSQTIIAFIISRYPKSRGLKFDRVNVVKIHTQKESQSPFVTGEPCHL